MRSPLPGWGINVTADDITAENIPQLVKSIRELRCDWIRFEFGFHLKNDQKIEASFLRQCSQHHIKILGLFNYFVPGTLLNILVPRFFHSPIIDRLDSFQNYVSSTVSRYSKYINHWEILNEPNTIRFWINHPNHQEYLQVLQKTSTTIHQIQPSATIVFAGIMGNDDTPSLLFQEKQFFKKCLEKGAKSHFSIANFHPYTLHSYFSAASLKEHFNQVRISMEKAYNYSKQLGQKKVWFTEFGVSKTILNRLPSKDIATLYLDLYHWCRPKKIVLFLWTLHDIKKQEVGWYNPEAYFGLLDSHLRPKPTYTALVSLVNKI